MKYHDKRFNDVTGIVLVGGKSTRYGRNKALEKIDGITLLEWVIRRMEAIFQDILLVTNTPDAYAYFSLPMVEDLIKGLGPLGGIYTGLKTMKTDTGFCVACDMPFINQELIKYMVEFRKSFDVIVPRMGKFVEPLYAVYGKGCLPAISRAIKLQKYQVFRVFDEVSVRYIEENEIRCFDPHLNSFLNINRPEELGYFKQDLHKNKNQKRSVIPLKANGSN